MSLSHFAVTCPEHACTGPAIFLPRMDCLCYWFLRLILLRKENIFPCGQAAAVPARLVRDFPQMAGCLRQVSGCMPPCSYTSCVLGRS